MGVLSPGCNMTYPAEQARDPRGPRGAESPTLAGGCSLGWGGQSRPVAWFLGRGPRAGAAPPAHLNMWVRKVQGVRTGA